MPILCLPSSSKEYIYASVEGDYAESMPVHMAVVPYGLDEPDADSEEWKTAQWDDGRAKVKIGTGSDVGELAEGTYGLWVKVTATDEEPIIYSGAIRIT